MNSKYIKYLCELVADSSIFSANGSAIPFRGWVEVDFMTERTLSYYKVLFLVNNSAGMEQPIFGYNVVECIIAETDSKSSELPLPSAAFLTRQNGDVLVL